MPDPSLLEMDDASLRTAAIRATLLAVTTLQRKMTAHADRLLLEHPREVGALAKNLAVALQSAIASEVTRRLVARGRGGAARRAEARRHDATDDHGGGHGGRFTKRPFRAKHLVPKPEHHL